MAGLLITLLASGIGIRSLKRIREQAEATSELVSLERPWIMVKPGSLPAQPPKVGFGYEIDWIAKNVGRTTAFLTELVIAIDTFPSAAFSEYPTYPESKPFAKFIIPPNGEHGGSVKKILDARGRGEVWEGSRYLVFFGKVKYRSGTNEYLTRFCSYWHYEGPPDDRKEFFEPVGPPNWVEYT